MSLEIVFGKNKTGKTRYLNDLKEKYKNENSSNKILFIPAEIIIIDSITKDTYEDGRKKNKTLTPIKNIKDFLKELINIKYEFELPSDEKDKLNSNLNVIKGFNEYLSDIKDDNFENTFKKCLSIENDALNKTIIQEFSFFEMKIDNIESGSSGTNNYSLLKLILEIIKYDS